MPETEVRVGPCLGSDHFPIIVALSCSPDTQEIRSRKRYITKDVDWDSWRQGLPDIEWDDNISIEQANALITTKIKLSTNKIKQTSGKYNPKYNKSWWNKDCSRLVALRRKAKNKFRKQPTEENIKLLRQAEKNAKEHIKTSKTLSWQNKASTLNSQTPLSSIWGQIKKIRNTFKPAVTTLDHQGDLYSDPINKTELFANFFEKQFNVKQNNNEKNDMFMRIQAAICNTVDCDYNSLFVEKELNEAISNLKNTSPGEDDIENMFIKNLRVDYLQYLLSLFNKSWVSESLPKQWKTALLVPIIKPNKNKMLTSSYRPISMLSCIGKLMERIVQHRLDWLLETNELLNPNQIGFRRQHSTYDQITNLSDEAQTALKDKSTCIAIFLDLSGAFDSVDHISVLFKLMNLGIQGRLLGWIQSYLQDRSFKILFEGHKSTFRDIRTGVPQGGILSPILFNILMSDLPISNGIHYSIYADDIALFASGTDRDKLVQKLQSALSKVEEWITKWGLSLNVQKTKALFFDRNKTIPLPLRLNNTDIPYVDYFKFLGVTFDSPSLSWSNHINGLKSDCQSRISLLKSLTSNDWGSDRKTLIMLYKSLIRSKLDYSCHVYNNASKDLLKQLEVVQNQCLRLAAGLKHTTPVVSLQAECNILPISLRRKHLSFKYYGKLKERPSTHPSVLRLLSHSNSLIKSMSFFNMKQDLELLNISPPSANNCLPYSSIPPWESLTSVILSEFSTISKNKMSDIQIKEVFNDMNITKYKNHTAIFTDGSKTENHVGSAFVVPSKSYTSAILLSQDASVLTSELYVLYRALKYCTQNINLNPFVIYSDSQSSINLLLSSKTHSYKSLVFKIHSILLRNKFIFIQWIPAHKSIAGNEAADRLARNITAGPVTPISIPVDDYYNILQIKIKQIWQNEWDHSVNVLGKGKALKVIKDKLEDWPWVISSDRQADTAMARLRVGHAGLSAYKYRFGMSDSPLCECGEMETVSHFLLTCNNYHNIRKILKDSIIQEGVKYPLSLKLLLGGSNLPQNKQIKITRHLIKYLNSTGKIKKL